MTSEDRLPDEYETCWLAAPDLDTLTTSGLQTATEARSGAVGCSVVGWCGVVWGGVRLWDVE